MISDIYNDPEFKDFVKREGFRTREEAFDFLYSNGKFDPYCGKIPSVVEKTVHEDRNGSNYSVTRRVR